MSTPTPDQSYCDLGMHPQCSGYTEDEFDPETCMCNCHVEAVEQDTDRPITQAMHLPSGALCAACHEDAHGYEPEMGDEGITFEPGRCSNCGTTAGIVFLREDYDGAPCCPDGGCSGNPCTFPGYARNN